MLAPAARRMQQPSCRLLQSLPRQIPKRTFCKNVKRTVAPPKPKKSNTKYYVAGGLLFFGVVCAEDIYNYPDGLLSRSELFPYIADCLNSLTDSFNDALQPTSDELLPEWPTAPCYAGMLL